MLNCSLKSLAPVVYKTAERLQINNISALLLPYYCIYYIYTYYCPDSKADLYILLYTEKLISMQHPPLPLNHIFSSQIRLLYSL